MKCRLHVGVEMVGTVQTAPALEAVGQVGEGDHSKRTALHCPVPGCYCVAIEYEEELKLSTFCRKCRKVKVAHVSGLCRGCASEYRRANPDSRTRARALHAQHC